ncbi:hypothetical protein BG006_010096 [Podila minutissima]|uniref:PHD-type domain-containing protein n=1 Tax=Podila minutissima TaxID=64525 RepID=A0A9P5SE61_9FUNG|nr:hypothetical protein BG006_010096 [Podila minutissima]
MRASKKYPSKGVRAPINTPKDKKEKKKEKKPRIPEHTTNAPISLSDSLPVYSQQILDGTMLLLPATSKFNLPAGATLPGRGGSTAGRGRGRGRARVPLAAGRSKYDASGAAIEVDFNEASPPPEDPTPAPAPAPSNSYPIIQTTTPPSIVPVPVTAPTRVASFSPVPTISRTLDPTPVRKEPPVERAKPGPKPGRSAGTAAGVKPKSSKKVGRPPKSVSRDVYCICRGPYDGVEFMIACDRCEEWFHGRCIGLKPQDAKKSNHYYCETCQKIRRMLGVATPVEEPVKSTKPKQPKKDRPRPSKDLQPSSPAKVKTTKTKSGLAQEPISIDDAPGFTHLGQAPYSVIYPPTESWQAQGSPKPIKPSTKTPKRKTLAHHGYPTPYYDAPVKPAPVHVQPTIVVPSKVSVDDDDDEDVCPVCDFECTCNVVETVSTVVSQVSTPYVEESHPYISEKVPFRPDAWEDHAQDTSTGMAQQLGTGLNIMDDESEEEGRGLNSPAYGDEEEDEEDVDAMNDNETFHTSYKNPMSTPTSHRRLSIPSIPRRSGKGIGKAPYLMQAGSAADVMRSRGKSLKGGKAAKHMYRHSMTSSESEMSDDAMSGDDENDHAQRRGRYESDTEEADDADDSLSLSSGSLSEDEVAPGELDNSSAPAFAVDEDTKHQLMSKATERPKLGKGPQTMRFIFSGHQNSDVLKKEDPEYDDDERLQPLIVIKKRGPGRPKKQKAPLVFSREDEKTLYTPAATSRKLTSINHKRAKAVHSPSKRRADFPLIEYDSDVAEDVMAVNAEGAVQDQDAPAFLVSDDDIFGDGDLSDELSGELSDIPSEDLDDLSDDALLEFINSEDDDDEAGNSSSSSPREFHYSEMEEEDESLVDSDSSINSISTDESNSSDSVSDPETDGLQVLSDEESSITFEQEGLEDLVDEEELMRLEEEERRFLAKAHSLHDDSSEEESDPGRNPFESSEDEDDEDDERVFDADGEYYSEEFYEDDYYDDDFEGMDEAQILARLKGVETDMQALMMIPPEQQEQLLLLQHYAELQQQQQQLQQSENGQRQTQDGQLIPQNNDLPLLSVPNIMAFDMNVPDLDAVSQQLADSIAKSMSNSAANAGLTAQESIELLNAAESFDVASDPSAPTGHASPRSASSTSPTSTSMAWAVPAASSSRSVNSIPTPANTPTPPGTTSGASPSINAPPESEMDKSSSKPADTVSLDGSTRRDSTSNGKALLPNSPAYKPLSSVVTSPSLGSKSSQAISKLSSETGEASTMAQLSILNQASNMFKEAAQRALSAGSSAQKSNSVDTQPSEEAAIANGETTEDASPEHLESEFRKRKGSDSALKETSILGKRRRLSTALTNPLLTAVHDADMDSTVSSAPSGDQSSSVYPNSSSTSTPSLVSTLSGSPTSGAMSPTVATSTSTLDTTASLLGGGTDSTLDILSSQYDFSKVSMPFVDPTAQMIQSFRRPSATQSFHRRRSSLKGKEINLPEAVALPMDDLLDTSALYGRSSSRSPSPERAKTGEDTEISPYIGLQSALKSGNVTMPATLLADHHQQQQQQQLLQQESSTRNANRKPPPPPGVRRHRSSSSASSLLGFGADVRRKEFVALAQSLGRQERFKKYQLAPSSSSASGSTHTTTSAPAGLVQTPPSVHAGMVMEDLAGYGALDPGGHHRVLGKSMFHQRSQSMFGSMEGATSGSADHAQMRRRRRGDSTSGGSGQPRRTGSMSGGSRAGSPRGHSPQHFGLSMAIQAGLGIGLESMASGGSSSVTIGAQGRVEKAQTVGTGGAMGLDDLMTDSSQLPSSACPTPLHSPLFSATDPEHRSDGGRDAKGVGMVGTSVPPHDALVSHFELDIGKEMDDYASGQAQAQDKEEE